MKLVLIFKHSLFGINQQLVGRTVPTHVIWVGCVINIPAAYK